MTIGRTRRTALIAAVTLFAAPVPAIAQPQTFRFDIPAQSLDGALRAFARASRQQVLFDRGVVHGRRSIALVGTFGVEEGLRHLLGETGLTAARGSRGAYVVRPATRLAMAGQSGAAPAGTTLSGAGEEAHETGREVEIVVTGTQIRGAQTPSPSTVITQREMRDAGFSDIGEVVRSLPQNFSGGQNPGVQLAVGAGVQNQNATSGSSLNLRGLGPDASLTLLNGRRLSYNGFVQAVDLSVVPIGAIERMEIVPDGASAIYGSDAIAGIANIILRRDFSGLETRIRVGGATDGGGTEYQLSAVAGSRWGSGGVILGYEYTAADRILSEQRDYLAYMPGPTTIAPERRQHSAILSLHQDVTDTLEFALDGLYTRRTTARLLNAVAQFTEDNKTGDIYTIAPSVRLRLANDWLVTLGGAYSRDESRTLARQFLPNGTLARQTESCWCNNAYSVQLDGEGPILSLPGGDMRLAIGAGYRNNEFLDLAEGSGVNVSGSRRSYFAFGELYLPIFGAAQNFPGIHRLIATAAIRYERYPRLEDVVTPKLGFIYEPTADFSLRGSWGRSFKTATLSQASSNPILYLYSAASLGATGYAPGATVLMPFGGNPDLRPERAETWSATLTIHPRAIPGLRVELSYFDVDYRDRVVRPLEQVSRTFVDPAVAQFLTLGPSPQMVGDILAAFGGITSNFTGQPFDPANVIGIADNRYANAARSRVRGVDASISYGFPLGPGRAQARGSASWLDGDRTNLEGQAPFETVGLIYNPAGFRARGGMVWTGETGIIVGGFANHLSSLTDVSRNPPGRTGAYTTIDASLGFRAGEGRGFLSNMELMLSVQNLFNRRPPEVPPLVPFLVNYDSTNYSAVGRFVSLALMRRW